MIRPGVVWTIARAEGRLTRRLVRYWVFLTLAWGIGIAAYVFYGALPYIFWSNYGPTFSLLNPRYLMGAYWQYYLMIFMVGIVFLAFDVRSRDVRERIVEVLDAKPFTNVELVLGRYVGLMMLAWIPVVIIGVFLGLLGAAINAPVQTRSLFVFGTFMAIPAMTFTVGLVFLLSIVLRFRWLGALGAIVSIIAVIAAGVFMPVYATVLTDVLGSFQLGWPSDLVFLESGPGGVLQRLAIFAAGLAMMVLAAALYPRLDEGSRPRRLLAGGVVMVVAAMLMAGSFYQSRSPLARSRQWKEAHEARRNDPGPDLLSMSGNVQIDPGSSLSLDLVIRITARADSVLTDAVFSLNPGVEVEQVTDASGGALDFTHENGLLEVRLPDELHPSQEISLHMVAEGRPDGAFAYLDSYRSVLDTKALDANIFILGFEPFTFAGDFVALMPGVRWLPASGAEVGRGESQSRPLDYYTLELDVDLPKGWLAGGPGRRRDGGPAPDGRVAFRFSPQAPVPEAALVASRFESRSVEINGIVSTLR